MVLEPEQSKMPRRLDQTIRSAARDAVASSMTSRAIPTLETHHYRTILACSLEDEPA